MSSWKDELTRIKDSIHDMHQALEKYLKLTGNPEKFPVDDLVTVFLLTGTIPPGVTEKEVVAIASEFVAYYGYFPVPTDDGFYIRTSDKITGHA